ncbi:MAG: 30S ribosomal protein S8 [Patescibacteria group bacterium]
MMTDPIADMLTQIRNASAVKKVEVVIPYSRLKHEIATVLMQENYLAKVEKTGDDKKPRLSLTLKYRNNGKPYIKHLRRLSVPSRRMYVTKDSLPRVLNDFGIAIISSSSGIMTNKQARRSKIGGELILEVW